MAKSLRRRDWPSVRDERGVRHLSAVLMVDGGVQIEGHDLGSSLPFAGIDGVSEYEYVWTVAAVDVPRLVEVLGGKPGDDVLALLVGHFPDGPSTSFSEFFEASGIAAGIWNHFSD